ncbi:MAG TPA: UDP-N-acetylmuramoyl-L-alanyl-D-glutamate--2,6-diaminopimelate ligase [Pyrinomonadaceae bacterium]|jgi:UDP-N-acetylmuramyl-tripeptide synthetase
MTKEGHEEAVTLGAVARATGGQLTGDAARAVADVTHDSRQVRAGYLFVAIRGLQVDAHEFVAAARAQGTVGVVSERPRPADFDGAWLQVADARAALALAAAEVHRHPSRQLALVGITGTNGKTTTAHLVAAMAEAAGHKVALLGTVGQRIGAQHFAATHTTPEASDTQRFLRRAVDAGCTAAVMECSSQALDLRRCDALQFAVAALTNLTRDHLDYHLTLAAYFDAKRRLFDGRTGTKPGATVFNKDDLYSDELLWECMKAGLKVWRFGIERGVELRARDVDVRLGGLSFKLLTEAGERELRSPLVGAFHVYNILAAVACGLALGYELEAMARAVETCAGAPGRFERVAHAEDFAVVVDYAHTDDALRNVLATARGLARGRVITVFGCGGDRDRTKRAPMGEAAAELSDVVILTSDNPRSEDPERILADVEVGLRAVGKPYERYVERRAAIHRAIAEARDGDVVVIAGKGHETYQIIGNETIHFDDREVAREALAARQG